MSLYTLGGFRQSGEIRWVIARKDVARFFDLVPEFAGTGA